MIPSDPARSSDIRLSRCDGATHGNIPRLANRLMIFSIVSLLENIVAEVELSNVNASIVHSGQAIQRCML
jgi:hypothetical protein